MTLEEHISKYCTYGEAIQSQTASRLGIDNTPNEEQITAMKYVATEIFDPVREFLGGPLTASSFFRSPALNKVIGGSSTTSQHMKGEAIDMFKSGRNKEIFDYIRKNLAFDQLIWEYGNNTEPDWVHCSKVPVGNRHMVLQCLRGAKYVMFNLYPI